MPPRRVLSSDEDSDDEPLAQQVKSHSALSEAQDGDDGIETSEVAETSAKRAKRDIVESEDDSDEEFTWQYSLDDMMGDAVDREYMASLPEVEREQILLERSEAYERAQKRWETKRRLKRRQQATGDDDLGRGAKRQISKAKAERNKGLQQLRKTRTRKKQTGLSDEEYRVAMMSSDEEEGQAGYDDEDYEDDLGPRTSRYDEEMAVVDDHEDLTEATPEELKQLKISRQKLEVWAHEPFLEKTVVGCLARVNIGVAGEEQVYRLGLVTGLTTRRVYTLGKTKTDKYLVIKHGQAAKPFRMTYVSNAPFTDSEYARWRRETLKADDALLTRSDVQRKAQDFAAALSHERSAADVQHIVQSRKKANAAPTNYALEKERIHAQLQAAQLAEDHNKIAELEELLDRLQTKKATLEASRYKHHASIVSVNERNRRANRAQVNFDVERQKREAEEMKSNYSVRRRTQPRLLAPIRKEEPVDEAKGDPESDEAAADKPESASSSKLPSRRASQDIAELHNFDLDIGTLPSLDEEPVTRTAPVQPAPAKRKGRGLDLSAYKKKMGLI
eukprot:m.163876 g.163876  ORF g.163876 m.163876 type:complete len:560 (-) comp16563_c0_seq3:1769-3448(-)